jgi:hypothetical protein
MKTWYFIATMMQIERLTMKVIGVDPAPKKGATIYDPTSDANGGWATVNACELPDHVTTLVNSRDDLLICWDAPLTAGKQGETGCYYERPIERFFRNQKRWTAPKGISIRAYAGCPHWAVTRAAVGLPKVVTVYRPVIPRTRESARKIRSGAITLCSGVGSARCRDAIEMSN